MSSRCFELLSRRIQLTGVSYLGRMDSLNVTSGSCVDFQYSSYASEQNRDALFRVWIAVLQKPGIRFGGSHPRTWPKAWLNLHHISERRSQTMSLEVSIGCRIRIAHNVLPAKSCSPPTSTTGYQRKRRSASFAAYLSKHTRGG